MAKILNHFLFLVIILSGFLVWEKAYGACTGKSPNLTAASAHYNDVKDCYDMAAHGDTINIPAGASEWTNTLTIAKAVQIIGAGTANTIIKSTILTDAEKVTGLISYSPTTPDTAHRFRISALTFDGNNNSNIISIYNNSITAEYVRIDHNKFLDPGYESGEKCIVTNGTVFGVIDNNTFDELDYEGTTYDVALYARGTGNPAGKTQWDGLNALLSTVSGRSENLYFEDNTITSSDGNRIMHGAGGRSVVRYNTFQAPDTANTSIANLIDIHGNQGDYAYSTMITEIYGNTADFGSLGTFLTDHRGGRSLQFFNNITSTSPIIYTAKAREEFDDATVPEENSYIQHVNNTYYWGNRKNMTTIISGYQGDQCSDTCGYEILENIDWWTERSAPFDGTSETRGVDSGVGCGTLADRPSTCTPGVAYWATDQSCKDLTGMVGANPATPISGTLYKCNTSGQWEAFYTPYTYPHPLRANDDTIPPAAPAGLTVN